MLGIRHIVTSLLTAPFLIPIWMFNPVFGAMATAVWVYKFWWRVDWIKRKRVRID